MEKEELQKKIARLESRLDQAETELAHLNRMLILCGFPDGVQTLKVTINELLDEAGHTPYPYNPEDLPPTQTFDFFS